jgi:hypothetical protein
MKKPVGAVLALLASSIFRRLIAGPSLRLETAKLKLSLMYVKSIKTFRLLFLSLLSIGICLVLLLTGLVLFHVSLFLYAPWSPLTKMLVGLLCSVLYITVAVLFIYQIFDADNWMKIFHADGITDHLHHDSPRKDNERPVGQRHS